jgi:methylenetetrahydrofolate reductase (NADPH)
MLHHMPTRLSRSGSQIRASFEFFPAKSEEAEATLWESIKRLEPLQPDFVSVTYGAGGTTRTRTHSTVAKIARETYLRPAAHLTCVGAAKGEVDDVIREYWDAGVRHIVALRGDPPTGIDAPYAPHPDGYQRTEDLVAAIKRIGDFEVSVSAYPEKHPQSPTLFHDVDALKRKVDAGADRAITQFFFDNSVYLRYLDIASAAGIKIPIVPGIVPVQNFKPTSNMAKRAGASVPAWLADRFEGLENDVTTRRLVAAAVCAEQVIDLIDRGVSTLHFYTMNRADLVYAICHLVGLRPRGQAVELPSVVARRSW